MKDEMGEIFAEELGGEVVQDRNPEDAMVIDLSTPEAPAETNTTEQAPTEQTQTESKSSESTTETSSESPVETPDSNRSLNNESDQQSQQENVVERTPEQNREEFLNFVNEQFKTEFDSIDSFRSALSSQQPSFANEQIAKMNQFVGETGRTIADYIRTQTIDYSKVSNEDVMRVTLKQENPELSMDEVNVLMNSKYKLGKEDKYSEGEKTLGKIELKKDVAKARKSLLEMQEKYRMPAEKEGMSAEQATKIKNEWLDNMEGEVDGIESVTFNINENGEEFTYQLSDDLKDNLIESNSNLNNYFDRYVDQEGKWNFDKLNMDMVILNNFEDIVRSVANQYRSKGTEQVVKDIKNPSFNNDTKSDSSQSSNIFDKLDDMIHGSGGGLKIG